MILTPILLLNMLIASMGNTYQRVSAISEKERIRQVGKETSERERIFVLFQVGPTCIDY